MKCRCGVTHGGVLRGPSVLEHPPHICLSPARVSALSHMGVFSHRRSVLRPLFRTLHGLLSYQRSSACFDLSVCHLSVIHLSVDLIGWPIRLPALLFPPRALHFVDSLDSELWYIPFWMQSCCFGFQQHLGRWAVFSAAFHHAERAPRVTSSLTA